MLTRRLWFAALLCACFVSSSHAQLDRKPVPPQNGPKKGKANNPVRLPKDGNPFRTPAPTNAPLALQIKTVKALVVIYDPVLKTKNNQTLTQYMKWGDPKEKTEAMVSALRSASGGYADYKITYAPVRNEFPVKRDGFRYDEESYLARWEEKDGKKKLDWHQPDSVSYAAIFSDLKLAEKVKSREIDEVWLWGAPGFGWDEYAMKIPGDKLYYPTENEWFYRPYDIPDCGRTVWVMGFNYERGVAEALHSFGHRAEGILSLTVGRGVWDDEKTPNNVWNRFTHQANKFPNDAQVGNVHGGPNAESGYDYKNPKEVDSAADDWLNYPNLTGRKTKISAASWGGPDYHLNYMKWWLAHLPKATGITGGFYNNWWRYVIDYDDSVRILSPPEGLLERAKAMKN